MVKMNKLEKITISIAGLSLLGSEVEFVRGLINENLSDMMYGIGMFMAGIVFCAATSASYLTRILREDNKLKNQYKLN